MCISDAEESWGEVEVRRKEGRRRGRDKTYTLNWKVRLRKTGL